jgi:dipeptidyl aminopeptidase/acylaminoacyl peptidase
MIRRFPALLAALSFIPFAFAADDKTKIEDFFKRPQYGAMVLSPDGENIAALAPLAGRQNVVVVNVEKRTATPVTAFTGRDIVQVRWVNNKRLLINTGSLATRAADARGGGLYAVDRDGSGLRLLGEGSDEQIGGGARLVARPIAIVRTLPGDGDDFIAQEFVSDVEGRVEPGAIFRIDSRTGRRASISAGKPDSGAGESWIVDRSGVARGLMVQSKNTAKIYYRKGEGAPWAKLDEFSTLSGNQWTPLAVADDGKSLLVASWRGRDKAAIVRYDPETRTFGEIVAAHPQVDLTELLSSNEGLVVGVRYDADQGGTAWFDETLASVQSAMDKALPGNVNRLSASRDRQRFIVTSYSDVHPGAYYLFERKTGKLEWMADRSPWIDPKKMSPMQAVRYPARDGLEIPAYLTVPKGSSGKNLPMVVMVHGGPWVPGDSWGWHPEVQFLASRGYAVLQPNFRGTTRYGWKHFSSSFKQWGLTMQDDVTDGVQWAVAQGVADPKRVCIYGGSYGGYATMMGLAKTPDLFKCGINYVGVTDLDLFLTATWSDFAYSEFLTYGIKDMLGTLDRERLATTSPVEMASRIKAPVLMAYGASDVRVVPEHGSRMKSALERAGRGPEVYMMVEGEGHGFQEMKNQVEFYGAMERFLDKHIGH